MRTPPSDPLLRSALREALLVFAIWAVALLWTVGYTYCYGYGRTIESLHFVLGIPDWVFWGVAVPWVVCLAVSTWFAFRYAEDDAFDEAAPHDRAGDGP